MSDDMSTNTIAQLRQTFERLDALADGLNERETRSEIRQTTSEGLLLVAFAEEQARVSAGAAAKAEADKLGSKVERIKAVASE